MTYCSPISNDKLLICPHYDFTSDDCPPRARRSREFDPHNPPEKKEEDPRGPLPCTTQCCACRPPPLRKKPFIADLKLKQLADCFNSRVPESCHNRHKTFYQRWQTYLDNFPRRFPNMDYTQYYCNDYFDLGASCDFKKYDVHLPLKDGPRAECLQNFLWMKNLEEANAEIKRPMIECPRIEPYSLYFPPKMIDPLGLTLEKRHNLYHEDGITRWRELVRRPEPKNFVDSATPYNAVGLPFRKDTSFTNPFSLSSGNDPPFKEFREVKKNL